MTKRPTVYDVAERARVSIATVSRVLRTPDVVKPETADRVLAAVRFLGYVPSANARGLAARHTKVIGLFFPGFDDLDIPETTPLVAGSEVTVVTDDLEPEIEHLYFDEVMRGAEIEAWRRGFALMIRAGRGAERESLLTELAGRVDGVAVLARTVTDDMLSLIARRIPVVVLAGADREDGFDHVSVDNGPGMRAVTSHVLASGVTRIAYVRGTENSPDDEERYVGFESALTEGITVTTLRGNFTRESGRDVARQLFTGGAVPAQAVICASDQMALGVLDVLEELGIRCPDQVRVTGFDGIGAARHSRPTLTTVHQPMVELGRAAVHVITERLKHPGMAKRSLTLPVRVVLRDSCP